MEATRDPLEPEVFRLRVPVRKGETEHGTLTLRPPRLKDALRADGRPLDSTGYYLALLSSQCGVPESALWGIVPEDWAELKASLVLTRMRFSGAASLIGKEGGEGPPAELDPFEPETIRLRVPIRKGEAEYGELTLQPPVLKDLLRADGRGGDSVAFAAAMLSSLSGVPESALAELVPEDWAELRVALLRANMRYMGSLVLIERKDGEEEGEGGDPTRAAGTPPPTSARTCAG